MPLILDRAAVRRLFTIEAAMECTRAAFLALHRGHAQMPQRLAIRIEEHAGTHLTMPCYVSGEREALATKVATVFERNPERGLPTTLAFLAVQDPKTGSLLALMDAEHLTAMRTAAASALATDLLAPTPAKTLTIFGTGGQAEAHLNSMLHVRTFDRIYVCARSLESAQRFCDREVGVEMVATIDRQRAVREADVICTTTNSTEPVFEGEWLKDGAHVNAIGAFRPDMRELDPATIAASSVVVDHLEAAKNGAGDLIQADVDWSEVTELGMLLAGGARVDSGRVTLFKSVGLAVQDAAAAQYVYDRASQLGVGAFAEL